MDDALRYETVEPVGTHRGTVHRNYGTRDPRNGWYTHDMPVYPTDQREEGGRIRERRHALGLTLGAAGRAAGLTAAQVSALERGAAKCDTAELYRMWEAGAASR